MKLRQHKHLRFIQAHQHRLALAAWSRYIDRLMTPTPEQQAAERARLAEFWNEIQGILGMATPRAGRAEHMMTEVTGPETMRAYNSILLGELVESVVEEPTGIAYLNERDQLVAVPLESDAGRHAVEMFKGFIAPKKFVVAKKTTGEIVGEFDVLADAEAVILKARRAKKQALVLL